MKFNLAKRIALFVGILVFVVAGGLGTAAILLSSNTALEEAENGLKEAATQGANVVDSRLQIRTNVLVQVAIRISEMDINQQIDTLATEVEALGYLDIGIVDLQGKTKYVISGEEAELGDREYVQKALKGEACFSNVLISKVTNSPVIMVAAPIKVDGTIVGALVARRDGAALNEISDNIKYGEKGYAYILGMDGAFYAHPNREFVINQISVLKDIESDGVFKSAGIALEKLGMGNAGIIEYKLNSEERIVAMQPIPNTNWMLGLTAPKEHILKGVSELSQLLIIISFVFVVIGIAVAIVLGRSISKPIKHVVGIVDQIAQYDLILEDNNKALGYTKRTDEIGVMAKAVISLQENLKELIKNIGATSEQVAASSEELTSTSQQSVTAADEVASTIQEIAKGANDQAKDTEQGAVHVELLGSIIEKDQILLAELNASADEVEQLKSEGFDILKILIEKTQITNQTAVEVRDIIVDTNESARKIEDASQMIKSIANQTNLLALNAAIEAARAGEAGMGFAVVADEIRKLAEQSNGFTEEIGKIIKELTNKSEQAVDTMEEVSGSLASQAESVEMTNTKFEGIASAIETVKRSITDLNQSSKEMGQKKNEIVGIIESLSAISEENAAGTQEAAASIEEQTASMEEIANASESLAKLAEEMQKSISQFKY
ncbi:MAG: methyl-accepting chemotaxis protein [Firmicutes bacterium HGW-Firmicutes-7]|nr:MAG: methyl-accepting chemotaxis protein [Firmicutes bacterium HGW-Firmicutes-7]